MRPTSHTPGVIGPLRPDARNCAVNRGPGWAHFGHTQSPETSILANQNECHFAAQRRFGSETSTPKWVRFPAAPLRNSWSEPLWSGRFSFSSTSHQHLPDKLTPWRRFVVARAGMAAPMCPQYERRPISQRTRDALDAKQARGGRLGAAPALPVEGTRRIIQERADGRTFQAIADDLMADGIPTARGKHRWVSATIEAVVTSDNAGALS